MHREAHFTAYFAVFIAMKTQLLICKNLTPEQLRFSYRSRRCSCSRSAIMAMNSLLVGLPLVLDTV